MFCENCCLHYWLFPVLLFPFFFSLYLSNTLLLWSSLVFSFFYRAQQNARGRVGSEYFWHWIWSELADTLRLSRKSFRLWGTSAAGVCRNMKTFDLLCAHRHKNSQSLKITLHTLSIHISPVKFNVCDLGLGSEHEFSWLFHVRNVPPKLCSLLCCVNTGHVLGRWH